MDEDHLFYKRVSFLVPHNTSFKNLHVHFHVSHITIDTNNFNESIGENPSLTSARNKANIECISGGGPSPNELAFGIELGPNPHSKRK